MRLSVSRALRLASALAIVLVAPRSVAAQWISYTSNPRNILEGNWQSCLETSGRYAERVYDHVVKGVGQFEVHLGPRYEFAIFQGVQDDHRDHNAQGNFLKPFRVSMDSTYRAGRSWDVPSLKLRFTVKLGGGSTSDCESWYILLEPFEETSH